jgi:hypothetical protein
MTQDADDAFARSVRFWLRAYPAHWREQRGAELAAVLADLAAPGARRLDPRSVAGLVRGGLATRRRTRPPLVSYLGYVLLGTQVPPAYGSWVVRDINAPGYRWRRAARSSALFLLNAWMMFSTTPRAAVLLNSAVLTVLVATVLATDPERYRRSALAWHLAPVKGRPPADGLARVAVLRRRLRARTGSGVVLGFVTLGAVVWSATAWSSAPAPGSRTAVPSLVVVALAGGLVLGALVAVRLRATLDVVPDQPGRVAVGLDAHAPIGLALLSALLVVAAALELTHTWGFPRLSLVGAPLCVVLLPSALVAWSRARRSADDPRLTARDLVRAAVVGRRPRVDRRQTLWVLA